MYNNPYQTRREPSNKEVWYSQALSSVENTNVSVSYLDRYINKLSLVTRTGLKVTEFIKKSQLYLPVDPTDQYYFVDASIRYRPDIISQEVYGTPILYWVILSCNNLTHPLEMTTALTVRVPHLSRILKDGVLV